MAFGIAPHRDHGMHQPVNRKALRRDRAGDRIDEERHVVIDHCNPQITLAAGSPRSSADAFNGDGGFRADPPCRRRQREARCPGKPLRFEFGRFGG